MRGLALVLVMVGACVTCVTHAAPQGPSTSNLPNTFSIYRSVQPLFPAPDVPTTYPLGHDLWLGTMGSADLHIQNFGLVMTATTSLTGGLGAQSVTVGSPTLCASGGTTPCQSSSILGAATSKLCPPSPSPCGLILDPDTASEESIGSGSWSIVNGTTLSITPTKNHTQPFKIRQMGIIVINARTIRVNSDDVSDRPLAIIDSNGNNIFSLPNDESGTWPTGGLQIHSRVTGSNGSDSDLIFRNALPTSNFLVENSVNSANILQLTEVGASAYLYLRNPTNFSLLFIATSDFGHIVGGGTSGGLGLYGSANSGGSGLIRFRNNPSNDVQVGSIDTSNGNTTFSGTFNATGNSTFGGTVVVTGGVTGASYTVGTQKVPTQHSATQQAMEAGTVALAGASNTATFGTAFASAPVCQCTDQTTTGLGIAAQCTATSTVLTVTGNPGDTYGWFCFGAK